MTEPILETLQLDDIRMRVASQGSGPMVLFCHGWPESWYSWRHQMAAVAAAGYRAVAPDMRGYGGTAR
jgi:pimeloyl-ACP methyl ester carboxylesterase